MYYSEIHSDKFSYTNLLDQEAHRVNQLITAPIPSTAEDLADLTRAIHLFRQSYRRNEAMDEDRQLLKEKFQRGKELGNEVAGSRD